MITGARQGARSRAEIRPARPGDEEALWRILEAVASAGDTFALDPDLAREDAIAGWTAPGRRCYVAVTGERVVGTYVLMPNQPGLGSHVANASYAVAPEHRGLGFGRALAEHSLAEARAQGYRAMQFNLVVVTNEPAIALWKDLGFEVVGRLPGAFHLRRERYVDALVMYRSL